ncbi:MAG: homocysteine S-methyltransferase [Xanthobacteraceae bacterium]|jgi:S-methylmethionine-dependent homocysteine/selenocysteine methylase|nr:homocysteine S-methyltransferase [Xanthobacteraceae bacterium]
MAKYRNKLPVLSDAIFLMDGGMETTFIFHDGVELPCFASFDLMKDEVGRDRLRAYYTRYIDLARSRGVGFVLDAPTWRANPDWGARLGHNAAALDDINRRSIELLLALRDIYETPASPIVVSGVIGPRGDGYLADNAMSALQAADYHSAQARAFAKADADMVSGYTLNYVEEAVGVAIAAKDAGLPSVISFTLETDGRLPTGQSLRDAIEQVDAETANSPVYYMVNCAHPTHFDHIIAEGGDWLDRIRGLRANASSRSHAELDAAPELDPGNPEELGRQYRSLRARMRNLNILGGCCGTDIRHVEQICFACLPVSQAA